jgi:hypothetical protein
MSKDDPGNPADLAHRLAARFAMQGVRWTPPAMAARADAPSPLSTGAQSMTEPAPTGQDRAALVDETYQYLFDEAHRALLTGTSFKPFGAGVRPDGERTFMHVDLPVETSSPAEHIAGLIQGLRQEAGAKALSVAGLIFDAGALDSDSSAVIVHMEAEGGQSMQVTIPYERLLEKGEILFSEPVVAPVDAAIFVAP